MKISILVVTLVMLPLITVLGQNPANFHIIYGNKDGSTMTVSLGDTVAIPCWVATSPGPEDIQDTVNFMFNPLMSNDALITPRLGGHISGTLLQHWDTVYFTYCQNHDNCNPIPPGFTSQSLIAYAFTVLPYDRQYWLWTQGDTILICHYLVRVTTDSSYIGRIFNPFSEGMDLINGSLYWAMGNSPSRHVVPTATYGTIQIISPACQYIPGDINGNGSFNGVDIVFAVNYFKGLPGVPSADCYPDCPGTPNPFYAAGDVNGNCAFNGIDITFFVRYLKLQMPSLLYCADCPPAE